MDRNERYDLFLLFSTSCPAEELFFLLISIRFFIPIIMGTMPIKPITWVGTTKEIKDPTILIAISKPIPRYWPNIILRFGKPKEEKNFDSSIAAIVPFHSGRLILYQPTVITIR